MKPILFPEGRFTSAFRKNKSSIVLGLVLFLVALLSFGLGYLMAEEQEKTPIIIEKNSATN